MTSGKKLQDYLQSVPVCSLRLAINTILGSLVVQCTGDELDIAIEVAMDRVTAENIIEVKKMTILETLKMAHKRVGEVLDRDRSDTWNQALLPLLSSVDRGCLRDAAIRLEDAVGQVEKALMEEERDKFLL